MTDDAVEFALYETLTPHDAAALAKHACPICGQTLNVLGCGATDGRRPCSVEARDRLRINALRTDIAPLGLKITGPEDTRRIFKFVNKR